MNLERILNNVQSYFDDIESGCNYYLTLVARANGSDEFDPEYCDYRCLPFEDDVASVEYSIDDLINATSMYDARDAYDALKSLEKNLNELKRSVEFEKREAVTTEACEEILEIIKDMLDYVKDSMSDLEDEF